MKINQDKPTVSRTDFFYYTFRNILLVSLPLLVISSLALSHLSFHSSATNNSSTDYVSINLPSSCTLSTSGNNSHTTSMFSGQLKEDIGLTEINTLCNDKDGYVVYAKGITQNSNNEVVLSSIIGARADIKTGNIPSSNGNSSWAFKLNPVAGDYAPTVDNNYNNKYMPIPNTWVKVASRSSGTSTNTDISDNAKSAFTTTYAAYTTPSQPAGTYSGQVQYILFHPSTVTNLANTVNEAFANADKTTIELLDPETGETGNFYKMQDMNTGICASIVGNGESTTAKLVDIRDNNLYYVTKLKDGNCWMTQNLALDLETTPTNVALLTSENTDLNDNSLSGAYEIGYTYDSTTNTLIWSPNNSTKTFNGTSLSGWTNSNATPSSARKTDAAPNGHQATGNYYNWTATIASDDSSNLIDNTFNNISRNPMNSICPKGWRLPIISGTTAKNEFENLNNLYNNGSTSSDSGLISSPLWLIKSGYISNNLSNYSLNGSYWSSTIIDKNGAYYLAFQSNQINPNYIDDYTYGYYYKRNGRSVRCLAR